MPHMISYPVVPSFCPHLGHQAILDLRGYQAQIHGPTEGTRTLLVHVILNLNSEFTLEWFCSTRSALECASIERAYRCTEYSAVAFQRARNHCLYHIKHPGKRLAHSRTSIRTLLIVVYPRTSCRVLSSDFNERDFGEGSRTRRCHTTSH
jgi:hypothetical protein